MRTVRIALKSYKLQWDCLTYLTLNGVHRVERGPSVCQFPGTCKKVEGSCSSCIYRWWRMTSPAVEMARTWCWSAKCRRRALMTCRSGVQTTSISSPYSRRSATSCVTAASRLSVHDCITSTPYNDIVCNHHSTSSAHHHSISNHQSTHHHNITNHHSTSSEILSTTEKCTWRARLPARTTATMESVTPDECVVRPTATLPGAQHCHWPLAGTHFLFC